MKINDGCVPTVIGVIYRQANEGNILKRNSVFTFGTLMFPIRTYAGELKGHWKRVLWFKLIENVDTKWSFEDMLDTNS